MHRDDRPEGVALAQAVCARREPHPGQAQTWAKAILMGEHSVVYGYPAIAMPLPSLRMWAETTSTGLGGASTLNALGYYGSLEAAATRFAGLVRAVDVAREFAGCTEYGFAITTRADFPAGRGLGSSAAASGAVIRAILAACDVHAESQDLLNLTNEAEKVSHAHPSGLDAITTSGQDTVLFGQGQMRRLAVADAGYLVIADSGVSGSTREAVEYVGRRYEREREATSGVLGDLGDLARDSVADLEQGNLAALGRKMNAAHDLLESLNVSHRAVNHLVRTARAHGALGAKMTGGGLGGCVVALAEDRESAAHVRTALLADGAAQAWIHPLAANEGSDDAAVE